MMDQKQMKTLFTVSLESLVRWIINLTTNIRLEMRNLKQTELQRLKNRGKKGWGYDAKKIKQEG